MSDRASAVRYARALFDVAQKESDPVQVEQNLSDLVTTIAGSDELSRVLSSRSVPEDVRRRVVTAIAERLSVVAPVAKLMGLLADRRRLGLLPEIAAAYTARLLDYRNILQADVQTAAPLAPDAAAALQASLAAATGKQITMNVTVDPSLLGGVVARVGSTVYDGSVRTQLKKMRDQLVAQG